MIEEILENTEMEMVEAIENMEKRFTNIRAGRANPAMLDGVMVNYYGVDTPLKQLATISIPEARQLAIKPFDRSSISAIEKGIYEANIGITPNNNGEMIILNIPALTEDTRREYVKQAKGYAEDCRIVLRNIRQDANKAIGKLEVPEDDIKSGEESVQELINKYNKEVDEKLEKYLEENEEEILKYFAKEMESFRFAILNKVEYLKEKLESFLSSNVSKEFYEQEENLKMIKECYEELF